MLQVSIETPQGGIERYNCDRVEGVGNCAILHGKVRKVILFDQLKEILELPLGEGKVSSKAHNLSKMDSISIPATYGTCSNG